MKLVTWNCQGALRNKVSEINRLDADVLIIQECEDPKFSTKKYQNWAGEYLWVGDNKNKGIGIFPKKGNKVENLNWNGEFKIIGLKSKSNLICWSTNDLKLFLPFSINGKLTVLAVWTKQNNGAAFSYIGQFWKYLQIHRKNLTKDNTLIMGDFNSNKIWDKTKRADGWWNHSSTIQELQEIGLESLYHYNSKEFQGEESVPTYFHQRKEQLSYHIDYVFCSKNILPYSKLEIRKYKEWIKISDHVPLITILE